MNLFYSWFLFGSRVDFRRSCNLTFRKYFVKFLLLCHLFKLIESYLRFIFLSFFFSSYTQMSDRANEASQGVHSTKVVSYM